MARPSAAVGKLFVAGDAGGGATIFRLAATLFVAMSHTHHMQSMFIVLNTIFQANVATIDGPR